MAGIGAVQVTIAAVDSGRGFDPSLVADLALHLARWEARILPRWLWIGHGSPPLVAGVDWYLAASTHTACSIGCACNLLVSQVHTSQVLMLSGSHRLDNPFALPFVTLTMNLMEQNPQCGQVHLDSQTLCEANEIGSMPIRDRLIVHTDDDPHTAGGRFRWVPSLLSVDMLRRAGPFREEESAQETLWARAMASQGCVAWSPELVVFDRTAPPAAQPLDLTQLALSPRSVSQEIVTGVPWTIARQVRRPTPPGKSVADRILLVGPWVGEFGWQVSRWQGGVRRMVAERYSNHYVIVLGDAGHEALYEYAHEYWTIPHLTLPLGLVRESERLMPKARAEAVHRCLWDALKEPLQSLQRPVDHLAPRRFLPNEQTNIRVQPSPTARDRAHAVLRERGLPRWFCIFPRQRKLNAQKNWPAASWLAVIHHLHEAFGAGVICMGGVDDTLALNAHRAWCIDASRLDDAGLDLDCAFLSNAIGAIGSESGGPLFALLCGCPTMVLGGSVYADRYRRDENPLGTPCHYLESSDFQHQVTDVVRTIDTVFSQHTLAMSSSSHAEAARTADARQILRIAYAGVFTVPHSDNIGHANGFEALGHTVLRYDFRDRVRALGNHQRMQDEFHRFLVDHHIDLAVFSKFEGTSPDILQRYNSITRTFLWWPDWERNAGPEIYGHFAHATWAACTGRPVAASIGAKVSRSVWHVCDGADTDVFQPSQPDPAFAYDVLFIGQRNVKRDRILRFLERNGYRCGFHGPGYREPLYRHDFARACSSAAVVLGINFGDWEGLFFSVRTWLTLACGSCFLPEYVNGMEELFENHRHVVWWRNDAELLDILERYVRRDDGTLRRQIGQAARTLTVTSYTWRHTAIRMLNIVNGSVPAIAACAET